MKKYAFLILLCCATGLLNAQSSNFLLYSYKGNVSVVEKNVESKAKVGRMLNNTASLKVAAGSVVTLICNEAAMFTISKPGTYALNKFGDSCKVTGGSVTSNYVKYVWAQMTQSGGSPGSNRKAYLNTVGAVERGLSNVWIDPLLDTVNFSNSSKFPLSWKSYAEAKEFDFYLFSSEDLSTPIFKTTVSKLKIPIEVFEKKLKPGNTYYWTAAVKGEENEDLHVLNYVTESNFSELVEKIKMQGAAFEAPAEEAYRIGFMLEDARHLPEAFEYYSRAASLDSTNVLYRSTLMSFKKEYEIK